jgi:hypothetical protein
MKDCIVSVRIRSFSVLILSVIFLHTGCPQTPPDDVEDMVITQYMTRVVYHYGSIKPLLVTVMDEGTVVKAHPTSDGWHKIWWFEKGKWKTGYVPDSCLMRVPDTIDHAPE